MPGQQGQHEPDAGGRGHRGQRFFADRVLELLFHFTGLVLGYLCLLGYGAFWLFLVLGLMAYSTSYGY